MRDPVHQQLGAQQEAEQGQRRRRQVQQHEQNQGHGDEAADEQHAAGLRSPNEANIRVNPAVSTSQADHGEDQAPMARDQESAGAGPDQSSCSGGPR